MAVGVSVAGPQITRDGIDDGLGDLRPTRAVEK